MENGNGYGYGHYGACELEKSLGDVESRLLMQMASDQAHISNTVSTGASAILRDVANSNCEVLSKIGDTKSSIVDRMGTYAQDNFKNQSDIAQRQSSHLVGMERDLQNRIHETRFLLSKDISDKTDRVSDKSENQFANLKDQLRYFESSVSKQICNLETEGLKNTSKILETLAANKYDALKDEVDSIRADRYADKYGYNFALQSQELNYLKSMINSVDQTQRFGSKTVQFGAGNTAGTAQTANQG